MQQQSIRLIGAEALREALKGMPPNIARQVEQTGCRRAAVDLRRKLRAGAPVGRSGQLRKAVSYRRIKYRRTSGRVGFKVSIRGVHEPYGNRRRPIANVGLARMFEYGSPKRDFPRRPFWNRTVEANAERLSGVILDGMQAAFYQQSGRAFAKQRRAAGLR